jgi:hypothetical protein
MADSPPFLAAIYSAIATAPSSGGGNGADANKPAFLSTINDAIAGKAAPQTPNTYETTARSLGLNATAGINDEIASSVGGPVDAVTKALNSDIYDINSATDAIGLGRHIPSIGTPFGGSETVKKTMGLIKANPDNVVPQNLAEKVARGVGQGVGVAATLPLGGELGEVGKVISPETAQAVRNTVGSITPTTLKEIPGALTTAGVNAAAGGGGTLAAEQNVIPVSDKYKPIVGMAGGMLGGLPVVAGHAVITGGKAAYDALPALTEASKDAKARATVAKEMQTSASDPSAAREALTEQPHEIIPGSTGTTGQIASDTGLLGWEGSVRQQNPEAFNSRAAEQNSARVDHLQSVQQKGSAGDLPDAIRTQRDIADQRSKEIVDQLGDEHQAELAKLQEMKPNGSPSDVAAHFRDQRDALDRATQTTVDTAEKDAQKYRDQIPASSAENVGAALRAPAQEARNAAKDRESQLWKAVDPDGKLAVGMQPVQNTANAIYGDMTAAAKAGLSPAEKTLTDVISGFKPVESFRELTDLRSLVSSKMREELQNSGRTPAYGRMAQLRGGVEAAIDGAVESRAVQDQGAVARGDLNPEQTYTAAIRRQIDEWRSNKQQATGTNPDEGASTASSGRTSSVSRVGRTASKGSGRSDDVAGDQGVSLTPNFDEAARDRLTAASDVTKTRAQTFDEGATGKILKPGSRAGEYRASDAQVPAAVFHPGPTGGEDIRHYIRAAGGLETATPALNDAAAISARAAAIKPDGTLDPAKLTSWAQKHAPALAELPASTRSRFEGAANTERAISDAMAARRDAIENFNKSEAAKVAGLSEDGDIVRHVGSIVDQKNGAQKMADLANAAKGKPAATEGLKRAVVENIFNRFLPEGRIDQMKSFIGDRSDVLGKVFDQKELSELTGRLEKAGQAGAKAEQGAKLRQDVLNQYDKGILGKIMNLDDKRDVVDAIGSIFGRTDAAKQMATVAKTAEKTPGGADALRKAVTEYLQQKFTGTAEAGTTGTLELNRANFLKFMREHVDTLGKVLDDKQIGKLSAIVQDQLRANRSITATKLAGGSDTTQKLLAVGKLNTGTILSHLTTEALGNAAGATAGYMLGGPLGAMFGKEGGAFGAKAMAALRDAGINRLNEMRVRAALDPEFGKALLSEMPKKSDRDAAALIGLRARQLSVAGVMAGVRNDAKLAPVALVSQQRFP